MSEAPGTVAELLRARAADHGVGLRVADQAWTWAEVVAEMEARAAFLSEAARPGPPHVGVLLENVPEYLFVLGGAALSGAVVVGVNPTRRGAELARDIRHTDCALMVTDAGHRPLLDGLDLGAANGRVLEVGTDEYTEAVRSAPPRPAVMPTPDDLLMLLFTSGSTGAPKAVRMTHARAATSAVAMWFTPEDVLYCAMPMFHGNALVSTVLPAIGSGASLVMRPRFSASAHMPDVRAFGCTFFSTVGRALSYIVATPETPEDRDHRLSVVLAPESSVADVKAFQERFGCFVISGYGSSENAVIFVPNADLPPEALGTPMDGLDVAIVDPDTAVECPPARFDDQGRMVNAVEAIGEIVGRNALSRFEGYYKNPEAEAARSRNGWYWTGDLGYRTEDGVFFFAGRNNDWLRVDGENFAAAPVERLLTRHPAVTAAAVFGVPDENTVDDQVMAVLELVDPGAFDPEEFDIFLEQQSDLGTKWAPRYVRVVEALPLMVTNKVDRSRLRAEGWEVDDAVYWRPDRRGALVRMTAGHRADVLRRSAAHGHKIRA